MATRLTELLSMDHDELIVSLVPTIGAGDDEQTRLMYLIGRL